MRSLAGVDTVAPIAPDVSHAVTGHRSAIQALLTMHEASADEADAVLGFDRTVFVPCMPVTLGELTAALHKVVAPESHRDLGSVSYTVDERLSAAVASFPTQVDSRRARALGMQGDAGAESLVREYIEDFPGAVVPGLRILPPP